MEPDGKRWCMAIYSYRSQKRKFEGTQIDSLKAKAQSAHKWTFTPRDKFKYPFFYMYVP